jgi:four helix bundle protein
MSDFEAWQACHQLALLTYGVTETFPVRERYGLASQARRAAFSAAANIAEGSAKRGPVEFRRYLDYTLGSLSELAYTLRLAKDLTLLATGDAERLEALRERASKLTWGLYRAVSRRSGPSSPVPAGQPAL